MVIEDRIKQGAKLDCIYDPIVYQVLKNRGHKVPGNSLKWSTAEKLDTAIAKDGRGRTIGQYPRTLLHAAPTESLCYAEEDCNYSDD